MKTIFTLVLLCSLLSVSNVFSQSNSNCSSFTATYTTTESRCAATGSISLSVSGGSGNYTYKVTGPVTMPVTSSSTISALSPGSYTVTVKDQTTGCSLTINNVIVPGTYVDPRFELSKTDVTCTNGSDATVSVINQTNGRNPFTYTIISPSPTSVGTSNSTGYFTDLVAGEYYVQQKDSCGGVQTRSIAINGYSWWISSNSVSRTNCTSVSASIILTNNSGNTNSSGSAFNGFTYGYVNATGDTAWTTSKTFTATRSPLRTITFVAKDRCGQVQSFTWTNPKPSFSSSVNTYNNNCSTFSASAQNQSNLTNPQFCLKQGTTTINCNSTGIFDNIPYGSYCITMTDACYDTTITNCFTNNKPKPSVGSSVAISNQSCSSFTASVNNQSNLFNPQYCLYDNSNVQLTCNTTGSFSGLAYGNYCIKVTSSTPCYDTTITRCFTVTQPEPSAADPVIGNRQCSTFDVSVPSVSNINSPNYCLFDNLGVQLSCNTTGKFNNVPYGSYCIKIQDLNAGTGCTLTPVSKCFTVTKNKPVVPATVDISNKQCSTFDASLASISRSKGLINPQYCLYDNNNNLITCNTTGTFPGIGYGSYCIKVNESCNDTTITRCFTATPDPLMIDATATQSCTIGKTDINVSISTGTAPFTAKVLNPGNVTVATGNFSSSSFDFTGLSALPAGNKYKVIVTDNCNRADTENVTPAASQFDRSISIQSKCPSAQYSFGSADVDITLTSTLGLYDPVIIKKDQASTTINYTSAAKLSSTSRKYTFASLAAATYIVRYSISSCGSSVYDTITISPYKYPSLQNSAVYQCDNNGFSVNAVANGGVSPFSYEIIGSNPSTPGITMPPQSSPIFNINTGTTYSLVRLRAIDACGNGALNDAGILPLKNISIISNSYNCYYSSITLSTDTIPNATYTWYKKTSATDSTIVGSGLTYTIPYLLPKDTGTYVVRSSVNSGCLTRVAYFNINGSCGGAINTLPLKLINFTGTLVEKKVPLDITVADESGISDYTVQRKNPSTNKFEDLGTIKATNTQVDHQYTFTDYNPLVGINEYRLSIRSTNGKTELSKTVQITYNENGLISANPNPVVDVLNIQFRNKSETDYEIALFNANGQRVYSEKTGKIANKTIQLKRNASWINGIYFLKIVNSSNGITHCEKLVFNH